MKSVQLNFFILPTELKLISDFFSARECYILVDKYISENKNPIQYLARIDNGIFQIYLINKNIYYKTNLNILSTTNDVEYFDNLTNPILEFTLGGFYPYNQNLLQRARLYYIESYYEENEIVYKKEEFLQWASMIIKDFKKEFLCEFNKDKSLLYSEKAMRWILDNKAEQLNGGTQWKAKLNIKDQL